MARVQAYVFGSGKLGLGLVMPALRAAGLDAELVVGYRSQAKRETRMVEETIGKNGRYFLYYPPGMGRQQGETMEVPCTTRRPESIKVRQDPPAVLCALAVGPSIDGQTQAAVVALAEQCSELAVPLHVVTCENRMGSDYLAFLNSLDASSGAVHVRTSVVDRLCTDRVCLQDVVVTTEAYWDWTIENLRDLGEADAIAVAFEAYAEQGKVKFVEDIRPYLQRKAYLVNGVHAALALKLAAQRPPPAYERIDEFVCRCDGILQLVEAMHLAYFEFLCAQHPETFNEESLRKYAAKVVARLKSEPDTAQRILARLTERDFEHFLISYYERIHEPMVNLDPALASSIVKDFTEVVRRRDLGDRVMEILFNIIGGKRSQVAAAPSWVPVRPGDTDASIAARGGWNGEVSEIQQMLADLSLTWGLPALDPGSIDGDYRLLDNGQEAASQRAVRAFKRRIIDIQRAGRQAEWPNTDSVVGTSTISMMRWWHRIELLDS